MKKVKILLAALGVALMAMFALAPAAQAQTLASVTADPLFVAAGGEQTFTMTGSGWPQSHSFLVKVQQPMRKLQQAEQMPVTLAT